MPRWMSRMLRYSKPLPDIRVEDPKLTFRLLWPGTHGRKALGSVLTLPLFGDGCP